jgi:hypothetical protein
MDQDKKPGCAAALMEIKILSQAKQDRFIGPSQILALQGTTERLTGARNASIFQLEG